VSSLEEENAALRERIELLEAQEADFVRRREEAEARPVRPPKSADGGDGVRNDPPGVPGWEPLSLNEEIRQAFLDKRFGIRHTDNHRPDLTPKKDRDS
jgi:hypothetical protein